MKDSKEILSHLYFSNSQKLKQTRCLNILKSLLPPRLNSAISYIYTKNQNLYIVIDQFGLKMEFNYKRELIKSLLKAIHKESYLCEDLKELEIIISVSTKRIQNNQETIKAPSFEERSTGNFENLAKNIEVRELIEKIRTTIHANRNNQESS